MKTIYFKNYNYFFMKGISPFISAVLLIIIVVSVAIVAMLWYTGMIRTQSALVGNKTSQQTECRWGGIRIQVESIKCDFSGSKDYLNFSLENSGSIPLYDFKAQVDVGGVVHTYNLYEVGTNSSFTSGYPLKPNEIKSVWVNITDNLPTADADWIRVVTQCPGVTTGKLQDIDCTP